MDPGTEVNNRRPGSDGTVPRELSRHNFELKIEQDHRSYLIQQKGRLYAFSNQPALWHRMYVDSLFHDYQSIKKFLPDYCAAVLDIGSGLGGIDILLARAYWDGLRVTLLDGEDDAPEMKLHSETFNSMAIAKDFLAKNGVLNVDTFNPDQVRTEARPQRQYDIIISLGSWCFHYPPDTYLGFVCDLAHSDTPIIVDVRRERQDYKATLRDRLRLIGVARSSQKFERLVFVRK